MLTATVSVTSVLAIWADTLFYHPESTFRVLLSSPTVTPLNSILYNSSAGNLAKHGLHPYYQHVLINLPQLIGPALFFIPNMVRNSMNSLPIMSAFTGLIILSAMPHQEARFLLPVVPLLLSSIRRPVSRTQVSLWLSFNAIFGALMGVYHQGGVLPAQMHLSKQSSQFWTDSIPIIEPNNRTIQEVFWWRTYPPPVYLLGKDSGVHTTDCMGMPFTEVQEKLEQALSLKCVVGQNSSIGLVAPWSSLEIDAWKASGVTYGLEVNALWTRSKHLNLDDLDLAGEGIWGTLSRVIGRRGLVIWSANMVCPGSNNEVILGGDL